MLTLGIINTYEKIKILDAHYRAIARAAPICYAYKFSLALFDFPYNMELEDLTSYVSNNTTIGNDGRYLQLLNKENHLYIHNYQKNGIPSLLGKIVSTTSKPSIQKKISIKNIKNGIFKRGSYLFLVGLGRKGIPKEILKISKYHLDITEKGIPLETCTAIGSIPSIIHFLTNYEEI